MTETEDLRYYQQLKLECLRLAVMEVPHLALSPDTPDEALRLAKAFFRSITEERWASEKPEEDDYEVPLPAR